MADRRCGRRGLQQRAHAGVVSGYDKNNESRNGTIVSQITAAQYASRFKANPFDIVLVHFGGADILRGIAPATVMSVVPVVF
jgi:hypothetical protein